MRKRNSKGNQIAELPAAIILLLLGIAFPIIIMASIFYKVYLFECIIKDGAQVGATQTDFGSAQTAATSFITSKVRAGVTCNTPTCTLVTRAVNYTSSGTPKTYNAYFLQVSGTGSVPPLVQMHDFFGMSVPGLTGPITLQATQAAYFENQTAAAAAAAAGS